MTLYQLVQITSTVIFGIRAAASQTGRQLDCVLPVALNNNDAYVTFARCLYVRKTQMFPCFLQEKEVVAREF